MPSDFDYFIVLAEMRTGSNFLETNLNAFEGVACHGEAFNPHFIGYPNRDQLLGLTQAQRDADPMALVQAICAAPGLNGFRFFHSHDPRVIEPALDDPRCAKIVLTRNPLDSYVSWKIARATNQWKLTDVKRRKQALAEFDAEEFVAHVAELQAFQLRILNRMQTSGQVAFYVGYEDLQDLAVMNGLARWLGVSTQLESLDDSLKPQNPGAVSDKVANPAVMEQALADLDRFNLTRTPNFEPRRGGAVPSYYGGVKTPLLYLPIHGGPVDRVAQWLAALDGVAVDALHHKMNQKALRQWKRKAGQHRSFTVLRHPADRIHDVFCQRILNTGPGSFVAIRETLMKQFKLPLPAGAPGADYTTGQHHDAFEGFLAFIKANLAGQTAIRVDAAWCSQSQALAGFGDVVLPDHVLREDELPVMLPQLARQLGHNAPPELPALKSSGPFTLSDIHDAGLEALIQDIYQRDYRMFGFPDWPGPPDRNNSN
jgi:LPS sulfotransferase NodH